MRFGDLIRQRFITGSVRRVDPVKVAELRRKLSKDQLSFSSLLSEGSRFVSRVGKQRIKLILLIRIFAMTKSQWERRVISGDDVVPLFRHSVLDISDMRNSESATLRENYPPNSLDRVHGRLAPDGRRSQAG